jgi:hypothetical protein
MKCLKVLILFFSLSVLFELTTTSANANECPITNGLYDRDEVMSGCTSIPAVYEIIIYEAYLCRSAPIIATTTTASDLSMCSKVFENTRGGSVASVVQNEEINLEGKKFKPANGSYTHAYAKLDKTFGITWSGTLDAALKSSTANGTADGVECRTVEGGGVFENGTTHNNSAICSGTAAAPGKFVETMNSFSDSEDESISVLVENVPGNPGATIQGIIVDVNGFASTGNSDSFRLEATMKNAKAIKITEATRGLSVKFSLVEAMSLSLESGSGDKLFVSSGPFISIMVAQN